MLEAPFLGDRSTRKCERMRWKSGFGKKKGPQGGCVTETKGLIKENASSQILKSNIPFSLEYGI
jgi:hypothetical protein